MANFERKNIIDIKFCLKKNQKAVQYLCRLFKKKKSWLNVSFTEIPFLKMKPNVIKSVNKMNDE